MKPAPTWPWRPVTALAPKGQRAFGHAPCNRGPNTTLMAAMTHEGLLVSMTVLGAANTEAFLTYLDQLLCPALRPGQVVVLDNLSVPKAEAVRARAYRSLRLRAGVLAGL
jgi:DDE superfamily endonuclease